VTIEHDGEPGKTGTELREVRRNAERDAAIAAGPEKRSGSRAGREDGKRTFASRVAGYLMELFASSPNPTDLSLWEIFRHSRYLDASADERSRIEMESAKWRYEYEAQHDSLERYFPEAVPLLRGQRVLDLGCFTGGRLVAWAERHGFETSTGIDINPLFAEAGRKFAESRALDKVSGLSGRRTPRFDMGVGERLPYPDASFDAIVSLDVFEHVQDVAAVMSECRRVLAPGGLLLACFPQYFQPLESHLGMFTRLPGMHLLFPGETLANAIAATTADRGPASAWYGYDGKSDWERSPYLNGITVKRFRSIYHDQGWSVRQWSTDPIFSDGRKARLPVFRALRALARPLAKVPVLEEFFLGRICCVLARPLGDT
jgi:SAM-dependent methyltransferase